MENEKFKVISNYKPKGDQPYAIKNLSDGFKNGRKFQTLLGVTGSGKTFTVAGIIEKLGKPTLVMAHNKTLAAQLYSEFKEFFPENAVEYFVSYYDYYQPEAYVPSSDTFIEKDSAINEEIDKLRHSATAALFERKDVIIIASVSCIYGLGDPIDYNSLSLSLRPGMLKDRDEVLRKLVSIQYNRNDMNFTRGTFRVRGDVVEIFPANSMENAYRIEFFGDEIEKISLFNALTGEVIAISKHMIVFPASHYVTSTEKMKEAVRRIQKELDERIAELKEQDKLVEAQRLLQRTNYDIEMMIEMGFCSGIENYSRHLSGRAAGETPHTLIDYFPDDFLIVVDESHVTIPQVGAMYKGDRSRKSNLVDYGFRLPSALDNRPLMFEEFEKKINQMLFVSATPSKYEASNAESVIEQIIRPTGLLDPTIEILPVNGQVDSLISEINKTTSKKEKVLVTTLTKKMSEDLTKYLKENGIRVEYLHSDIQTLERLEIIRDLRLDKFDVLIGINLLREGLDIPEVSLVAILDADKEGFLRNESSLIQTIGRAARNSSGRVILYADQITNSMQRAISETERRRKIQEDYNKENGIVPKTINKKIHDIVRSSEKAEETKTNKLKKDNESMTDKELKEKLVTLEKEMKKAALSLEFEKAAKLRDEIKQLKEVMDETFN